MKTTERARTVPCPACKVPADSPCVDVDTLAAIDGVHMARADRERIVAIAVAENEVAELRAALGLLRQAAEQYLDTEHRSKARDLELRARLGELCTDAALLLFRNGDGS